MGCPRKIPEVSGYPLNGIQIPELNSQSRVNPSTHDGSSRGAELTIDLAGSPSSVTLTAEFEVAEQKCWRIRTPRTETGLTIDDLGRQKRLLPVSSRSVLFSRRSLLFTRGVRKTARLRDARFHSRPVCLSKLTPQHAVHDAPLSLCPCDAVACRQLTFPSVSVLVFALRIVERYFLCASPLILRSFLFRLLVRWQQR